MSDISYELFELFSYKCYQGKHIQVQLGGVIFEEKIGYLANGIRTPISKFIFLHNVAL